MDHAYTIKRHKRVRVSGTNYQEVKNFPLATLLKLAMVPFQALLNVFQNLYSKYRRIKGHRTDAWYSSTMTVDVILKS